MLSIRFSGSTISPKRTPNLSPTITTSPFAIFVLLTIISKGSPANRSNSTTEPSFKRRRSLIVISVLPTSTVRFTSIFSRTFRFSVPSGFSTFSLISISSAIFFPTLGYPLLHRDSSIWANFTNIC